MRRTGPRVGCCPSCPPSGPDALTPFCPAARHPVRAQIDAAINSGNSGGPAFNDEGHWWVRGLTLDPAPSRDRRPVPARTPGLPSHPCLALSARRCSCGIAFQSLKDGETENIGYIIPPPVVHHFLSDFERHGRYTGFPSPGFEWQKLENPDLRKALLLKVWGSAGPAGPPVPSDLTARGVAHEPRACILEARLRTRTLHALRYHSANTTAACRAAAAAAAPEGRAGAASGAHVAHVHRGQGGRWCGARPWGRGQKRVGAVSAHRARRGSGSCCGSRGVLSDNVRPPRAEGIVIDAAGAGDPDGVRVWLLPAQCC